MQSCDEYSTYTGPVEGTVARVPTNLAGESHILFQVLKSDFVTEQETLVLRPRFCMPKMGADQAWQRAITTHFEPLQTFNVYRRH